MPQQHSREEEANQDQGIMVPLELEGLRLLKQEVQPDGTLRIEVIGTNERARCIEILSKLYYFQTYMVTLEVTKSIS